MYLVVGIVFIACGGIMFFKPRIFFKITESWKNNTSNEPSDLYVFSTKVGGVIVTLLGIASATIFFVF